MKRIKIFTIGVYGSNEQGFFNNLEQNKIDTFCDVRRRRGVRGSEYAFVNSERLQHKLSEIGIKYYHVLELAPTDSIRYMQKEDDLQKNIRQRKRQALTDTFISRFKAEILADFDFADFLNRLEKQGAKNVVFFCVEANASACHRSLISEKLNTSFGYKVKHL